MHTFILFLALAVTVAFTAPCHQIGTWQRQQDAPTPVTEAACAQVGSALHTLIGFDDYAGGGLRGTNAHWVLDLDTGAWTEKAPVPYAGSHAQATSNGTHIFIAGGLQGDYPGTLINNLHVYSIETNTWTELAPLPHPGASAGFDYSREQNKLFYFSGLSFTHDNSSSEAFFMDLSVPNPIWVKLDTAFPDPRNHFLAKRVRPELIVMPGGQHGNIDPQPTDIATVIGFDPVTFEYRNLADLPAQRSHSDSVVANGRLVVVGGRNNQAAAQIHNDIVEYNPDDDTWSTLAPMPGQRLSPCVALHQNASGWWLWMTKGGIDWNIEVAETWVAKVEVLCNYTDPTLPPSTTLAPSPSSPAPSPGVTDGPSPSPPPSPAVTQSPQTNAPSPTTATTAATTGSQATTGLLGLNSATSVGVSLILVAAVFVASIAL